MGPRRGLDNQELARDGAVSFGPLVDAVAEEVAGLMKEAGRNESEQEPGYPRSGWMPLAARRLRVPLVHAVH